MSEYCLRMSASRLVVGWKTTGLINGVRVAIPRTVRPVVLSTNHPRFTSTKRVKWCKKSAPKIGVGNFATTKIHWNVRRNPKFKVMDFSPNIGIGEWFTACNCSMVGVRFSRANFTGMTLTSASVSTRKRMPVVWSLAGQGQACRSLLPPGVLVSRW